MDEATEVFENERGRLRAVAVRMLGGTDDADDVVQEAWLKWSTADRADIDKPAAWLTTVVSRLCLDKLRSRGRRGETPLDDVPVELPGSVPDPASEAELADSVDAALLVVLDLLSPAERLAFVLHDLFALPFDEISAITGRTPAAVRQLASRGRRRVQDPSAAELAESKARQQRVVDAFFAASKAGEFDKLLELLDPDAVIRADGGIVKMGGKPVIAGAQAVAERFNGQARAVLTTTLDGYAAGVWQLHRVPQVVFGFVINDEGRIVEIEQLGDPDVLASLDLAR
ncbi:RNA polymerase sigma-70 factor (ECF subfamily) [Nocardioides thalensis]|uniref:RNA polymerase sigma-70 factor (ECF subfamily) n=1 Tax=Nocardioides thalensis TaxID=1914755 RepID=A0A853C7E8_9ACTN|nr:RNA polymerase sigma-70 factor (ECF subfamily) [Nocardioides thalensis]